MKRKNKGFSLVELIVVIAIMAILVGVAIPVYTSYIVKTQKANDKQLVSEYVSAIALGFSGGKATGAFTDIITITPEGTAVQDPANNEGNSNGYVKKFLSDAFGADYTNNKLAFPDWENDVADIKSRLNGLVISYQDNAQELWNKVEDVTDDVLSTFNNEALRNVYGDAATLMTEASAATKGLILSDSAGNEYDDEGDSRVTKAWMSGNPIYFKFNGTPICSESISATMALYTAACANSGNNENKDDIAAFFALVKARNTAVALYVKENLAAGVSDTDKTGIYDALADYALSDNAFSGWKVVPGDLQVPGAVSNALTAKGLSGYLTDVNTIIAAYYADANTAKADGIGYDYVMEMVNNNSAAAASDPNGYMSYMGTNIVDAVSLLNTDSIDTDKSINILVTSDGAKISISVFPTEAGTGVSQSRLSGYDAAQAAQVSYDTDDLKTAMNALQAAVDTYYGNKTTDNLNAANAAYVTARAVYTWIEDDGSWKNSAGEVENWTTTDETYKCFYTWGRSRAAAACSALVFLDWVPGTDIA